MAEVNQAAQIITEAIDRDARVIFGAVIDEKLKKGEVKITVVATGFDNVSEERQPALVDSGGLFRSRDKKATLETETSAVHEEGVEDDAFEIPAFIRRKMK